MNKSIKAKKRFTLINKTKSISNVTIIAGVLLSISPVRVISFGVCWNDEDMKIYPIPLLTSCKDGWALTWFGTFLMWTQVDV